MRNVRLTIQYDGTSYQGWQTQRKPPNVRRKTSTIQETIEKTLQKILQEKIHIVSSGRTDTGVHALAQVANLRTYSCMPATKIKRSLNALLPKDIVISDARDTSLDFNARFDARLKTYRYRILNRKHTDVFNRLYQHHIPYDLNLNLMKKEAKALIGRHDFKSFQASDKRERASVRTIRRVSIRKTGPLIIINVEANGFLYNMVRNIVGTLIEIGRGRFEQGSMKKILKAKDRKLAGPTAPAKGLCLLKVTY